MSTSYVRRYGMGKTLMTQGLSHVNNHGDKAKLPLRGYRQALKENPWVQLIIPKLVLQKAGAAIQWSV